ncbi:MAG: YceI family protein [Rhodanobacteraceae bacterium]
MFVFALLLGIAHRGARAADDRYETVNLDGARSQAKFSLKAFWLIDVHGTFGRMHGTVRIDHFRSEAVVDAHIDVNAVHMANPDYERGARSAEFFDAARYPDIHFVSDAFPLLRLTAGGPLPGMLDMHGNRNPVDFLIAPAACQRPAIDCPLQVSGVIRRSAFGMHARRATLSDKVTLSLSIFEAPGTS